jgi:DNA mismatch repair protein MutH
MGVSHTIPVGRSDERNVRVGKPSVFKPKDGTTRSLRRGLKKNMDMIGSGACGRNKIRVKQGKAPFSVNQNPV